MPAGRPDHGWEILDTLFVAFFDQTLPSRPGRQRLRFVRRTTGELLGVRLTNIGRFVRRACGGSDRSTGRP